MLTGHEVALALGLRADGDHQGFALAEAPIEVAPSFQLGHAIGAPASAKKLDDQGTEGEHIFRANQTAAGVVQSKLGSQSAGRENAILDAGGEELRDRALPDGQPVRLD